MGSHLAHGIPAAASAKRLPRPTVRRKADAPSPATEPEAGLTEEQIARRAYEIYEARGDSGGDALSDWLTAERELRERAEASACTPKGTERDIYH